MRPIVTFLFAAIAMLCSLKRPPVAMALLLIAAMLVLTVATPVEACPTSAGLFGIAGRMANRAEARQTAREVKRALRANGSCNSSNVSVSKAVSITSNAPQKPTVALIYPPAPAAAGGGASSAASASSSGGGGSGGATYVPVQPQVEPNPPLSAPSPFGAAPSRPSAAAASASSP